MVRAPCCEKMGLKKGPWTPEEDQILISYIQKHGHGNWRALPKQAGLLRCGKSCRLRWINYLRPDIKRGSFTQEEEETIFKLHEMLGNRWSAIAARLPGRTDNEIKNIWHTHLKKKLKNYQPPQATKRHSSTMPGKVAKPTDQPIASKAAPVSPQESSSEMSSVTDSLAMNMNPNGMEIKREEMNSPEYFPQIDESFWSEQSSSEMSSSVTDSSAMNALSNDQLVIKNEEMDSSVYIRQMDKRFWSRKFPADDSNTQSADFPGITEESRFEFPSSGIDTTMECDNVCVSSNEDDMDFWFNLFIRAVDMPDLPEF